MKTRIVSSVTTTLLLGSILMNPVANAADSDINIKTGTTDIGSNTTVKTGDLVTYDKENGMHKKVFYSFIDDKNHNKKTLVIRTKGTIAGQYRVYSEEGANKSGLAWPSAFKV